jgi:hypothetical protein
VQIKRSSIAYGKDGHRYKMIVCIESHLDLKTYPEGVRALFKLIRLDVGEENETQLLILIDNHFPFGFHSHDCLPSKHNQRTILHVRSWKEAWAIFQNKCKEILK